MEIKKLIFLFCFLISLLGMTSFVSATYWCGDGFCEAEYCPSDCTTFLESYCDDRIEVWECDEYCGTTLGWIRPYECTDYGYTPTEDCEECEDCPVGGILGDFPAREDIYDFCDSYGFIRPEDCASCEVYSEETCMETYELFGFEDCPACAESTGGFSSCDSCCNGDDCPFQWWLLVIGGVAGYFLGTYKKKSK